jgi:hypothetical protein
MAIQELLEHAASTKADVRILTGSGTDKAYGRDEIAGAMKHALEAPCKVRILVWNDAQHPVGNTLRRLQREFSDRMEIRISDTRKDFEKVPHFLTVGKEANRLEMPHPPYDDVEFTDVTPLTHARICFRDSEWTSTLNSYFDSKWEEFPAMAEGQPGGA